MTQEEYDALKLSIRESGQLEPILTCDGQIIDGRHRERACLELGLEPTYQEWTGEGSLIGFVVAKNQHRRHLSQSQRAAVAVSFQPLYAAEARKRQATSTGGANPQLRTDLSEAEPGRVREQLAGLFGVSPGLIEAAQAVRDRGVPGLLELVKEDRVAATAAALVAGRLDAAEQAELVRDGPEAIRGRAAALRKAGPSCRPAAAREPAAAVDAEDDDAPSEPAGGNPDSRATTGSRRTVEECRRTVQEWLEGHSLRQQLKCPDGFDRQARLWRELFFLTSPMYLHDNDWDPDGSAQVLDDLASCKGQEFLPLVDALKSVLAPDEWRLCPACQGEGVDDQDTDVECSRCRGWGFHVTFIWDRDDRQDT
jgi:hypothetical protein